MNKKVKYRNFCNRIRNRVLRNLAVQIFVMLFFFTNALLIYIYYYGNFCYIFFFNITLRITTFGLQNNWLTIYGKYIDILEYNVHIIRTTNRTKDDRDKHSSKCFNWY